MYVDGLRLIFVCATPGEGRCGAKGGSELLEAFRKEVIRLGLPPSAVLRNACTPRQEAPTAAFYVVEEGAPVQGLCGTPPELYAKSISRAALGSEADHVAPIEKLEGPAPLLRHGP